MTKLLPLVVFAAALAAVPSPACAPAPMRGEYVEITQETALIIWDRESKTEHFIRRANFQSSSPDFGFLVPTPVQPELAEADESVFDHLSAYTAPKIEYRTVRKPRPPQTRDDKHAPMAAAPGGAFGGPPRGVEVLDQTEVGGQEAVVLKFHRGPKSDVVEDAKELADWLKKRGYEFGPQLVNWLKPYIENDWVMTAFRIAKRVAVGKGPQPPVAGKAVNEMHGKAVRMTFKTDTPFYPYREPESPKEEPKRPGWYSPGRFLRVFLLADRRMSGTLGDTGGPWTAGSTAWTDKLDPSQMEMVAVKLKIDPALLKNANWLTEFEDRSSPRKGTDEVYFKANDGPTLHRPVIIREVVEYYDDPDASAGPDAPDKPAPYWLLLTAIIGGVAFVSILALLLVVILRQR
ncbi:MAG: DUF2330 domain-containing protein [Gemmataceae bacterium]